MNTVNLPRAAVSILKVIDQAISPTSQSWLCCTAFLPSEPRSRAVQPNSQLDFADNRARTRNWSDRILGRARILGVQRGGLPEGVFLYVELFDFEIQRRPRNSELGGRTIWPSNFSLTFRTSRFDEFLLIVLDGLRESTSSLRPSSFLPCNPALIDPNATPPPETYTT